MDLTNTGLVTLIFVVGAAAGALLNSIYRMTQIARIKAEFIRTLEKQIKKTSEPVR